ncbi:acyl-CoA carboxylase subunit epsilon [Streptomyces longwoodensis]|uniref:acyl-CoA carboxylase subunit epsilon n=1 Tax=Streptomyces longwoodensis TaxID=68231 RepID=UPI0033FB5B37
MTSTVTHTDGSATGRPAAPLVRVVRGGALPAEELAALTAVLLSRAAALTAGEPEPVTVVPLWEGPGARSTPYRSPVSWRD